MGASKLTLERMKRGITQKAAAAEMGLNNNILNRIERRALVATPRYQKAILSFMGGRAQDYFEPSGIAK